MLDYIVFHYKHISPFLTLTGLRIIFKARKSLPCIRMKRSQLMRLKDKVVIVTASTRGIGKAIVDKCAAEGAIVYMAARNKEKAEEEIKKMGALGKNVKFVFNDATEAESFETMVDEVYKAEGRVDVLINNFGTSDPHLDRKISDTDADYFLKTLNINLGSVFRASQSAVKVMEKQKNGGSIVNISSVAGSVVDISQIAYGTSKAAINYLTKLIAVQEAQHNIRCNAIMPGLIETDATKEKLNDTFKSMILKQTPLNRTGKPEDIANTALFLASDESSYITGEVLMVSGGFGTATPLYGDFINSARFQ